MNIGPLAPLSSRTRLPLSLAIFCLLTVTAQAQPTIFYFESDWEPIVAGTRSHLAFEVNGADTLVLSPGDIQLNPDQRAYTVEPLVTTTYTLTATNELGSTTKQAVVEVGVPFVIERFDLIAPGSIGLEDEIALRWSVVGNRDFVDVSIDGLGPQALYDEIFVVPGVSRDYTLRASAPGLTDTRTLSVEVTDEFNRSRYYLSFSPDEIDPLPPDLSQFIPFNVYVLGGGLDGGFLAGVEFGLDIPAGLMIAGTNFNVPQHLNIMSPPDYVVGLGLCDPIDPALHLIATINFTAIEQSAIDDGVIRLRPAGHPSIPGHVAYATCNRVLELSELDSPLHAIGIGPPLPLDPDTSVPVLELDLRAERRATGVGLRWEPLPMNLIDRVVLSRSVDGRPSVAISSRRDEELNGFQYFEDPSAPLDVALEYTLSGFVRDELVLQAHTSLKSPMAPLKSALVDAYPNPFNPSTTIRFDASRTGLYEFAIVNAAGRRIRTLSANVSQAGTHEVRWNGMDDTGRAAASGVYFVEMRAQDAWGSLRIVLLK